MNLRRPYIQYLTGILLMLFSRQVTAQNNTSPYSIIGIGDIEQNNFDRTSGMANTGLAYRSPMYLIQANPASYTALQDQFFNFELGARGCFVQYAGSSLVNGASNGSDFSIEKLGVGIKIKKWWGSGVGLAPFSNSSYYFSDNKNILGSNSQINSVYEGTGGVHQVYWSNGFQPVKNLSIGVTTSILFGSLTQTDSIVAADQTPLVTTSENIYLRNFYFNYGLQYYAKLNKRWDFGIGGVFSNKSRLLAEHSISVTDGSGTTLKSDITKNDYFNLPLSYGVGLTLTKDKKYTFSADYKYQNWSSLNYKGNGYSLEDSRRLSAGFELSKKKNLYGYSIETMYLQAGAYYSNSYLDVYGQQLNDYGITIGFGGSLKRSGLGYGISLEVGSRGTQQNGLVQEKYTNLVFKISYRDFWFTKGRKYD